MQRATASILMATLVLGAIGASVAANHVQTDSGNPIVFKSKGGNEWWAEVVLSGQGAGSVAKVEAMDDGGPWVTLTAHPEWAFGDYAGSFHVEPGHRVMFRASWSGGAQQLSCWFTHPAGAEQCGTPPPPPPPGNFTATFTLVTGNEWWEQTQVTPSSGFTVSAVDVHIYHGSWGNFQPLKLQSWGVREYAGSYHAVQGDIVQFRAIASTGNAALSSCYQWIPPTANGATAQVVACPGSQTPPPPSPSSVAYTNVKGNEWWIEAKAISKSPIAGVNARVNGGTWVPMKLQSWGSWAVSTHAVAGSHVQFRAMFPDGTFAFIPNGYTWTSATEYPPPSSTFDARFENVKGNPGWVQVNVYASSSWGLQGVDYRVDGGAWQPLARQSYGDWTAVPAATIPDGARVQFLAKSGQTLMSPEFVWPSGRAVTAWPVEGSFVTYRLTDSFTSPGGDYSTQTRADLRLQYHAGAWSGTCYGHTDETNYGSTTHTDWTYDVHEGPFTGPKAPIAGSSTNFHPLETDGTGKSCAHNEAIATPVGPQMKTTHLTDASGRTLTMRLWYAQHDPNDPTPEATDIWWETHFGLVLEWSHSAQNSGGYSGWVTDTDAPIR